MFRRDSRVTSRYRVREVLEDGPTVEVLAVDDEQLGREVIIKRLAADSADQAARERFLREARMQGRLQHPAIVPVHDVGRDDAGVPFFAIKRLTGRTLAAILGDGDSAKASRQRLLRGLVEACFALEYAHAHGVTHGPLAADHLLFGDFGEVYVLDWSRATDDVGDAARAADVSALVAMLRATVARDGAPAPELVALCDAPPATPRALAEGVDRYLDADGDLATRARLASERIDAARAAAERGDASTALHEAGRALALDPKVPTGAELVQQLMREPPSELPAEVTRAIAAEDEQIARVQARGASIFQMLWLGMIPVLLATNGIRSAALFAVLMLVSLITAAIGARTGRPTWITFGFVQFPIVALVSWLFTPLIAIGVASQIALLLATTPQCATLARRIQVGALLALAALSPVVLALLGFASARVAADQGGVLIIGGPLGTSELAFAAVAIMYVAFVIVTGIGIARTSKAKSRVLRERLALQHWQVAQLAPEAATR